MQEIMHGQVCKRDVCCGFHSKQCSSSPALMKCTEQVKGTSSVLIYLNLPAEDQYQILIPEREITDVTFDHVRSVPTHRTPLVVCWQFGIEAVQPLQLWSQSASSSEKLFPVCFLPQWHYGYGFFQLLHCSCSGREHGDHELHLELGKFRSLLQMWFVPKNAWREMINKERLLMCQWDAMFLTKSRGGTSGESGTKGTNVMFSNYHLPAQAAVWFMTNQVMKQWVLIINSMPMIYGSWTTCSKHSLIILNNK